MPEPYLSVIIPAYNEEDRILPSLEKIWDYLKKQPYTSELIVVSDGSRDDTARVAEEWRPSGCPFRVIDRKENKGKGYSVREGATHARGEYILFSDADLSTPIEELEKLLPYSREGFDIVIGSRGLRSSQIVIHQPWYRVIMGRVFNGLVQMLAVPGIKDTQCGFKYFSRSVIEKVFPQCRVDGFAFDVEILYLARKLGLKIKEIPIRWIDSPRSTLNPMTAPLRMLKQIIQVRIDDWRGKYSVRQ